MITINLILQQWQGMLSYEIQNLPGNQELPADLLTQLLKSGLNMYIQRYLICVVHYPTNSPKPRPCLIYRINPHTLEQPLYISTENNTLYELLINFDNLAPHSS